MPDSIGNAFIKAILNSPLHPLLGERFAIVTVVGRKTGKQYATPINVTKNGDAFTATSLRSRTWWRNLRGERRASLRVSGQVLPVCGEVIEDQERVADGLARLFHLHPDDARFLGIHLLPDGAPPGDDLRRAAGERVIVRFHMNDKSMEV
jgi:deazaflavin-dependent oxidoreductase (nitroreductase family)